MNSFPSRENSDSRLEAPACHGFFLVKRPPSKQPPSGAEAMCPERDSAQPRRGESVGSRPGRASPGRSAGELPYPDEGMAELMT